MKLRAALAGLAVAAGATVGGAILAGSASAAPLPAAGITCSTILKDLNPVAKYSCPSTAGAPTPGMPDAGTAGTFDPTQAPGTSDYSRYGYGNLTFPLWDVPSIIDHPTEFPNVVRNTADNTAGNAWFGAAVDIDGAANGLERVLNPPKFMNRLNVVAADAAWTVDQDLWTPYSVIAILLLAIMVGVKAWRADFAAATHSLAWMILVIGMVGFATLQSVETSSAFDSTLPQINADIYSHVNLNGGASNADQVSAAGTLEEDEIFYPLWLQAELGSATSPVAVKYGPALFDSIGYTWAQANSAGPGKVSAKVKAAKAKEWNDTVAAIQKADPSAYDHITGAVSGKTSAGILAFIYSAVTNPLRIVASLMTLIALIVLAFGLAVFPAVALVGVNDRWAGVIDKLIMSIVTAAVGAVGFSIAAAVSIIFDSFFLNPAYLPRYLGVIAAGVVFLFVLGIMRPRQALAGMLGGATMRSQRRMGRVGRRTLRRAIVAGGVGAVAGAAYEHNREREQEQAAERVAPEAPFRPEAQPAPVVPDVAARPERAPQPDIPPLVPMWGTRVDWGYAWPEESVPGDIPAAEAPAEPDEPDVEPVEVPEPVEEVA